MSDDPQVGSVTMDTRRFLTAAVNLLHAAFVKSPRAQARRHFARLQGGNAIELATMRLEGRGDVLFRVSLDHSAFRGKLGFPMFRRSLDQLLGRLAERVRLKLDVQVYASEQTGQILFNVPAVVTDAGVTNVLMLGVGKPDAGVTTLELQFLDPEQFRKPPETAA